MVGFLIPWTMPRWGSGGVRTAFNFTLMSDAQLQASGWSWTRPNAILGLCAPIEDQLMAVLSDEDGVKR